MIHGVFTIDLDLEDALPNYREISSGGLALLFDASRNSFELVNGGIHCGDNYTGPLVYPSQNVAYTKFTRIQ